MLNELLQFSARLGFMVEHSEDSHDSLLLNGI